MDLARDAEVDQTGPDLLGELEVRLAPDEDRDLHGRDEGARKKSLTRTGSPERKGFATEGPRSVPCGCIAEAAPGPGSVRGSAVGTQLGDRLYRRLLHCLGALAVLYLILPSGTFVVVPTEVVLLAPSR